MISWYPTFYRPSRETELENWLETEEQVLKIWTEYKQNIKFDDTEDGKLMKKCSDEVIDKHIAESQYKIAKYKKELKLRGVEV